jgi:hypothetical protein
MSELARTPSAVSILADIRGLSEQERQQLRNQLESDPTVFPGFILMEIRVVEKVLAWGKMNRDWLRENREQFVAVANTAWRRSQCNRKKPATTQQLDTAIEKAQAAGITEPEAILAYLREFHTALVRNIKNADNMMLRYRRRCRRG